ERILRTAGANTSLDAGRGCPYQCSFCTIINVQGRKSRYRSADDCEKIVRANVAQGIHRFFITDDNFARNKNWEAILDRMIELLEFFYLTPLPGSEDHRNLHNAGKWMDPDVNKYDLNHCVTAHTRMTREEWEGVYRAAWDTYYTDEHIETVLRRAIATGISPG